jgi:modulator of FtsH protease HflC
MTAYETGLKSSDTRFLLRPDSEFFRFFAHPSGNSSPGNGSASSTPATSATANAPKP